jgi:glycosyltransferase involved in cell wall biosynthesis
MASLTVGIYTILDPCKHGGLECYIASLARGLESHNVSVFLNGATPDEKKSLEQPWQSHVKQLLPFMTRSSLRSFARLAAQFKGFRWAEKSIHNCDIVHFVGTGWDLLGFPLQRAAKRKSAVMTCWPAIHAGSWGDSALDIDLYRSMDSVFVQSRHESQHLTSRGIDPDRLTQCGCAPSFLSNGDAERFRGKYGLAGKDIVLFVGRKTTDKGYHSLREAIGKIAKTKRNVVLVSIGRDVAPPYPELAAEIDIDLGSVDESQKQDAFAACDVFVLPSKAESFGIVYVEAWSYGKPVVCGTATASRELVEQHGGGLVSNGTPEGIAVAIGQLLTNPSWARSLGQSGKQAVEDEYTIEKVVDHHLEIWGRLKA